MKKINWKRPAQLILCILLAVSLGAGTACTPWKADPATEQKKEKEQSPKNQVEQVFSQFLSQIFQAEITASTLNMHYTLAHPENYGIKEYPVTYGTINADASKAVETAAILENWKSSLSSFKREELSLSQQMTYDILEDYITHETPGAQFILHQEILKPTTGIQAQLPVLMAEYTFYDEQDVQDYLKLLEETQNYFKQILQFEIEKSKAGMFMSRYAVEDIISQCRNFTEDPEHNYMLSTFDDRVDAMEGVLPEQAESYKVQNRQLVTQQVIPAYEKLIEGLEKLKDTGKNSQGLCYLDHGKEYYEYLVAETTGSSMSVKEMKSQTEVQRQADMDALTELLKKNPALAQQCNNYSMASQDPSQILQDLQGKMQKDFPAPPDTSFTIKSVHPSLEEYTAPAFYLTPPIDDISQNSIYINTSRGYQKIQLYTTLAHEGYPGHLYQNLMERSCGLEPVRSLFGSSGYAEGWATYVEMQSYYYADIDKELAGLLQKNQSALLSLYATADMGIHYDGWSLADTVDFFGTYQITDKEVIKEIYQLIVEEPAHYLKYYIGYLEFLNLREYAVSQYGEDYSNYKFHQALMKMGNAPFSILKQYLTKYWK